MSPVRVRRPGAAEDGICCFPERLCHGLKLASEEGAFLGPRIRSPRIEFVPPTSFLLVLRVYRLRVPCHLGLYLIGQPLQFRPPVQRIGEGRRCDCEIDSRVSILGPMYWLLLLLYLILAFFLRLAFLRC